VRERTPAEVTRDLDQERAARLGMGGVARRGAGQVRAPGAPAKRYDRGVPERDPGDRWVDAGPVAERAIRAATDNDRAPKRRIKALPDDVLSEVRESAGPRRAGKLSDRLGEALTAFDADRYSEARAILAPLAIEMPAAASVRELLGLTLYRMERWKPAAGELEAYRTLTGETDQHPVLADCYRALRRFEQVDELWDELKAASPSPELMAEGRMVAAGALADRDRLSDAIELLERSLKSTKKVAPYHLRQWYALADLYDRAGEAPKARTLFTRIRDLDPAFADTVERLRTLGR
jgi:tetratricopeptide (TPR) repeat protein